MATYDSGDNHTATQVSVNPGLVTYTQVMYVLHAIAIVMGVLTSASIVGSFVFSLPSIIAVVMNYIRRSEARGTWLESHFRWQLRTFWTVAIASLLVLLAFGWLVLVLIGIPLLIVSFFIIGIWAGYRILRGWLALTKDQPLPM